MRKTLLLIGIILISGTASLAQTKNDTIQQLQRQIVNLEKMNSRLSTQLNVSNSNIRKLEGRISATADSVAVMKNELVLTNMTLQVMASKFELQIQQLSDKSNSEFSTLSKRVNNNTLYWILAIVLIALLPAILFGWLKGRLTTVKTELSDQIKNSSNSIREEIIKIDNQVF